MFPVSVKCMEDYARLHEIVLKAEKIYYISRPLYFYRMRGDSLTAKTDLEIEFNNYLIAKGRNTFLRDHGFTPPPSGYIQFVFGAFKKYHLSNAAARAAFKEHYEACRADLKRHVAALLRDKDGTLRLKIKILLELFSLYGPYVCFQEFIKNHCR